jgi:hypothetical protein
MHRAKSSFQRIDIFCPVEVVMVTTTKFEGKQAELLGIEYKIVDRFKKLIVKKGEAEVLY